MTREMDMTIHLVPPGLKQLLRAIIDEPAAATILTFW
jgi:hypothetical protein